MNVIFECKFGSVQYGTNTPVSDDDRKGIYLPTSDEILFNKIRRSVTTKREKGEGEKNYVGEVDYEFYSLDGFFKLIREGQTVALDVLFSTPVTWIEAHPPWGEIYFNRYRLISRRSGTFIGYCRQQAKKYGIKGSRVAAARTALNFLCDICSQHPTNLKLGEFDADLRFILGNKEFINWPRITQNSGLVIQYMEVCGRKLSYTASIKMAYDVLKGLVDEYGRRALLAEKNEGLDWKALSHAVRIGQQAVELFETHDITFPRPNAPYLLQIKQGQVPYCQVAEEIEDLFIAVEAAAEKSGLPDEVDTEWLDNMLRKEYKRIVTNG